MKRLRSLEDMTPAMVLLLFREGIAYDWISLCQAFGYGPDIIRYASALSVLHEIVLDLARANLLVIDGFSPDHPEFVLSQISNPSIELSLNTQKIFTVLLLSLKEMAAVKPSRSMFVEPLFGRPNSVLPDERLDLFVLMPFSSDLKGVYEDHIKNVAASLKLKVERADDFFTAHAVVDDIWTAICQSRAILADCTGRNPNVFYEIGLAHTVGKPVVLITQDSKDIPFDIAHHRHIPYEYTPRGMKTFESTLTNTLQTIFDELGEP